MPVKDQVVRAWIEQTAGAITDLAQSLDEADRAGLLLDLVRAVDRGATRAALEALPERFGASRREHRSLLMVFNAAVEHATTLCVMGSGGGTTLFVRPPRLSSDAPRTAPPHHRIFGWSRYSRAEPDGSLTGKGD